MRGHSQIGKPVFCAISPESSRMDVQACLHRHADIRRATDREQRCCELAPESSRMDVQACLHGHTDIRRATDREQRCCELAPEKRRE